MKYINKNILLGVVPFLLVAGAWSLISHFAIVPRWIIPSPMATLYQFWELMASGELIKLAWVSLQSAMAGFILAATVAIVLGIIVGIYPTARKMFMPFFSAVYIVPSLAWLPLIVIIFGFSRSAIICLIFMSSFKKIIYSVINGVRSVNISWILAGRNIGLSRGEVIYKIIFPASLPHIITGLRLGFGSAWKSLVGAEMLVAGTNGLGRFIWNAQWFFAFDQVFAGIITIALIGVLVEQLVFRPLEDKILVRWGFVKEE